MHDQVGSVTVRRFGNLLDASMEVRVCWQPFQSDAVGERSVNYATVMECRHIRERVDEWILCVCAARQTGGWVGTSPCDGITVYNVTTVVRHMVILVVIEALCEGTR